MAFSAEYLAACARTDAVMADFAARCRSQAVTTVARSLKNRARNYRDRPMAMEALPFPGLSCAAPEKLIAVGEALLNKEARAPRRFMGFGGEVPAINAKAVILLGRWRRRFDLNPTAESIKVREHA